MGAQNDTTSWVGSSGASTLACLMVSSVIS